MSTVRTVIVHFHLFKNAGTSVERGLESHFGDTWVSFDKSTPGGRVGQDDLLELLTRRPDVQAVSSHQLRPPLVGTDTLRFLPVVYLRHPLDRIRSAYDFERKQGGVSPSSRAAETRDLAGWIDFHRERGSTQVANFQTLAFSRFRAPNGAPLMRVPIEDHLQSAIAFLGELPAVGLVESFESSWLAISQWLREYHGDFNPPSVHSNSTTSKTQLVQERMEQLDAKLGQEHYERLVAENTADLELHTWASDRFGR